MKDTSPPPCLSSLAQAKPFLGRPGLFLLFLWLGGVFVLPLLQSVDLFFEEYSFLFPAGLAAASCFPGAFLLF